MSYDPVECPECLAEIEVSSDVVVGEIIECPDCGAELEVYEIDGRKVKVRLASSEEEDWGE